jgi:hypothetical protein
MAPYYGTVEAIRGHSYNARAARTVSNRARHFEIDYLSRLHIPDLIFLHQSLPEMFVLFAMYVVHLGMGHTLLYHTIKEETIRQYLNEAGTRILESRQNYKMRFPQAQLTWFHPLRNHGESKMAPGITDCLNKISGGKTCPTAASH